MAYIFGIHYRQISEQNSNEFRLPVWAEVPLDLIIWGLGVSIQIFFKKRIERSQNAELISTTEALHKGDFKFQSDIDDSIYKTNPKQRGVYIREIGADSEMTDNFDPTGNFSANKSWVSNTMDYSNFNKGLNNWDIPPDTPFIDENGDPININEGKYKFD